MNPAIADFLAQKNIAVAGVSRKTQTQPANLIYRKLRDDGYRVFPVNPATDQIEGGKCYPNLASIPAALDGVVIATRPSRKRSSRSASNSAYRGSGCTAPSAREAFPKGPGKGYSGGLPHDVLLSGGPAPSLYALVPRRHRPAGGVAPSPRSPSAIATPRHSQLE